MIAGRSADIGVSRGNLESRGSLDSRASSRMSTTSSKLRLEIDELEAILKEKLKNNYSELKKRFKDNDPDQKGNVTKSVDLICTFVYELSISSPWQGCAVPNPGDHPKSANEPVAVQTPHGPHGSGGQTNRQLHRLLQRVP